MSFLIKEYILPFMGKTQIIEGTGYDKSFNGKYYIKNFEGKILANHFNSLEEVETKSIEIVKKYFEEKINLIEGKIIKDVKEIKTLESFLEEFQIIDDKKDWLEKYRPKNEFEVKNQ